jgi:hypothetical protein
MENNPPIVLLILVAAALFGLAGVVIGRRRPSPTRSWVGGLVAAFPAVVMVGLFYSLAVHMRQSLGEWPASLGYRGFPASLVTHAKLATGYFSALLLGSLFVWPVAVLVCALVPRWRAGSFYLGIFALAGFVGAVAMMLAPEPFLVWWWD